MERSIKDVTLVLIETGRTVKHGRRRTRETVLKTYHVKDMDGTVLGIVEQGMQTFEHKIKGERYVASRWESPRWFWYAGDTRGGRRPIYVETRKQAVEGVLWAVHQSEEAAYQ